MQGYPEVTELQCAIGHDEDVLRGEVAVNGAHVMQHLQRARDRHDFPRRLALGVGTSVLQVAAQVALRGKLGHQGVTHRLAIGHRKRVEHLDDVGHTGQHLAEVGLPVPGGDHLLRSIPSHSFRYSRRMN